MGNWQETENRNMRRWRERQEMEGIFLLLTTQWAPGGHILYTEREKNPKCLHMCLIRLLFGLAHAWNCFNKSCHQFSCRKEVRSSQPVCVCVRYITPSLQKSCILSGSTTQMWKDAWRMFDQGFGFFTLPRLRWSV